jgi:hypothetical protein
MSKQVKKKAPKKTAKKVTMKVVKPPTEVKPPTPVEEAMAMARQASQTGGQIAQHVNGKFAEQQKLNETLVATVNDHTVQLNKLQQESVREKALKMAFGVPFTKIDDVIKRAKVCEAYLGGVTTEP